jgi:excinuclease UvrABC helicase subunit UvrB
LPIRRLFLIFLAVEREAAKKFEFERAAKMRNQVKELKEKEFQFG